MIENKTSKELQLDADEIKNMGYLKLIEGVQASFTNLKVITINNEQYFYTKNPLKISSSPIYSQNIFYLLCATGQSLEYISQCLESSEIKPSARENYAICIASKNGHYQVVELLLKDEHVDPSDYTYCAIRWANENGHHQVVELLLKDKRVDPADYHYFNDNQHWRDYQ